ncbi:transposase [Endozoicomonadaceae bacterium StTr2]
MAERKRANYNAEFRQKTADFIMASDIRISDIAKTLNVVPSTLSNWVSRRKKQLSSYSKPHPSSNEQTPQQPPLSSKKKLLPSETEVAQLRQELQKLRQERKVVREAILLLTT